MTFYIPHVFSTSDWSRFIWTQYESVTDGQTPCVSTVCAVCGIKWYILLCLLLRQFPLLKTCFGCGDNIFCFFCLLFISFVRKLWFLCRIHMHSYEECIIIITVFCPSAAPVCDTSCDIILKWINCWVMTWLNDGTLILINIVIVHLGRLVM